MKPTGQTPNRFGLNLTFHGATGFTTGTRHLIQLDDKQVLMDCGMYQGHHRDINRINREFGFDPAALHSVLLSHAHIDHSGALPSLTRQGYTGPIYCTPPTMSLCEFMLRDSAHIQERDAEWLNRRPQKRGSEEPVEAIYTMEDAEACLTQFRSVHYHRRTSVLRDLEFTFYDAGHILGSASIVCEIRRGERLYRLAFSGDIGRQGLPLLRDPEIPYNLDWLIMEGTYGSRTHDPIGEAKQELLDTVKRTAARGGKIIVPSFSVERTQEIVYYLNELRSEGLLPPIRVFVDSPLATNVTEVFRQHSECFDAEARAFILEHDDPFGFSQLTYTRTVEESKALNESNFPCMIISASGMCTAGRIRHHLRNGIGDPKNCIMFVGYQAEGTLGRRIVEREPEVRIFGEMHRVRAEIVTLNTMSGHADKNDLFQYAKTVRDASPQLKRVFLVHGEQPSLEELGGRLRQELALEVSIPKLGEQFQLDGGPEAPE